jgi:tripartite-type tricarboxylate transporter receptor subunit TctC
VNAVERYGARSEVEQPRAIAAGGNGEGERVGAVERLPAAMQVDGGVAVAGGHADHAGLGGGKGVDAGGAEVARAAHGDGADARIARQTDRVSHGLEAGQGAMPVVRIERSRPRSRGGERHARASIDPASFDDPRKMGQEPHPMAVDAEKAAVQHGSRRSLCRRLVRSGAAQHRSGEPLQAIGSRAHGGARDRLKAMFRQEPLPYPTAASPIGKASLVSCGLSAKGQRRPENRQAPKGRKSMPKLATWLALAPLAGAANLILAGPAVAQQGADFYKGKTVTYIVATAPGGNYDLFGRLVADYMQKYLPGSTFIVRNMPGAGHLIGANAIYASRPDGLTIGTFNTGLIYNQLIGLDGVKFDLTKMSWIGKGSADPRVIVIAEQTPIKTFEELRARKEPVTFASAGVGSASFVETTMLTNALKLPVRVLTGYSGGDDELAMRRGEIMGALGSRSTFAQFVENGYARQIVQIGGKETDTPQLRDLVTDPTAKQLIALVQSQGDISRLTAGPPGIPKDRLDALRTAYQKAMEDPELRAKAERAAIKVDPAYGDDVLAMVKDALNQTPEAVAVLKAALDKKDAPAASVNGTVAELKDDGRQVVLKLADGKTFEAAISGSRTEVTVAGQKGDRKSLKAGMACTVEAPKSGAEAKTVICN